MSESKQYEISKILVIEAYKRVKANKGSAGIDGIGSGGSQDLNAASRLHEDIATGGKIQGICRIGQVGRARLTEHLVPTVLVDVLILSGGRGGPNLYAVHIDRKADLASVRATRCKAAELGEIKVHKSRRLCSIAVARDSRATEQETHSVRAPIFVLARIEADRGTSCGGDARICGNGVGLIAADGHNAVNRLTLFLGDIGDGGVVNERPLVLELNLVVRDGRHMVGDIRDLLLCGGGIRNIGK